MNDLVQSITTQMRRWSTWLLPLVILLVCNFGCGQSDVVQIGNDQRGVSDPESEQDEIDNPTLPQPVQPAFKQEAPDVDLPPVAEIDGLVRDLKDANPKVRSTAAFRLAEMRLKARDAIPDLIEALKDEDVGPRVSAARALGSMGALAEKAIPVIVEVFAAGKLYEADTKNALKQIGGAEAMLPMIQHEGNKVRATGLRWISEISPVSEAQFAKLIPKLATLIEDENREVCFYAFEVLSKHGPAAKPAIPSLIQFLSDENGFRLDQFGRKTDERGEALRVVASIGPDAKPVVPLLLPLLHEERLQSDVIRTLGSIGPGASNSVADLLKLFNAPKSGSLLKREIIETLGQIGPASEPAVRTIAEYAGNSTDPALRSETLKSLSQIGNKSQDGIPFLIEMLQSKAQRLRGDYYGTGVIVQFGSTADIRGVAAWALTQIGDPSIPHLVKLLGTEDPEVGELAAISLARIGETSVEPLEDSLANGDSVTKFNGLLAMERLASSEPKLFDSRIELIRQLLSNDDYRVRMRAIRVVDVLNATVLSNEVLKLKDDKQSKEVRELATEVSRRLTKQVALGDCWRTLSGHSSKIDRFAIAPNGATLAAMSQRSIRLWRPINGVAYCEITVNAVLRDVAFAPDGKSLAGVDSTGVVRIWRVADGLLLRTFKSDGGTHIAYSPCGTMLAVTVGRPPSIWDVDTDTRLAKFTGHDLLQVRYSDDGKRLIGIGNNRLDVLDVSTGKRVQSIESRDIADFDLLADGTRVVFANGTQLNIFSLDTGLVINQINLTATATNVAYSIDGDMVAVGQKTGAISIFKCADLSEVMTIETGTKSVAGLAFLRNGKYLASITDHYSDDSIHVWKVRTE